MRVKFQYLPSLLRYDQSKFSSKWLPIQISCKSPYHSIHFIFLMSLRIRLIWGKLPYLITQLLANARAIRCIVNVPIRIWDSPYEYACVCIVLPSKVSAPISRHLCSRCSISTMQENLFNFKVCQ